MAPDDDEDARLDAAEQAAVVVLAYFAGPETADDDFRAVLARLLPDTAPMTLAVGLAMVGTALLHKLAEETGSSAEELLQRIVLPAAGSGG